MPGALRLAALVARSAAECVVHAWVGKVDTSAHEVLSARPTLFSHSTNNLQQHSCHSCRANSARQGAPAHGFSSGSGKSQQNTAGERLGICTVSLCELTHAASTLARDRGSSDTRPCIGTSTSFVLLLLWNSRRRESDPVNPSGLAVGKGTQPTPPQPAKDSMAEHGLSKMAAYPLPPQTASDMIGVGFSTWATSPHVIDSRVMHVTLSHKEEEERRNMPAENDTELSGLFQTITPELYLSLPESARHHAQASYSALYIHGDACATEVQQSQQRQRRDVHHGCL
ncbi:uncharacterized protein BKA78DRAFT_300745 [Phyllosticta capitalensis]|uniref:uncharacterized protein n=1 Tax=Phyllosticta capitalensis TaxID=121624 RepID=UPI00312E8769